MQTPPDPQAEPSTPTKPHTNMAAPCAVHTTRPSPRTSPTTRPAPITNPDKTSSQQSWQASPTLIEGTHPRLILPVWTCPDIVRLPAQHQPQTKVSLSDWLTVPFKCPPTSFSPHRPSTILKAPSPNSRRTRLRIRTRVASHPTITSRNLRLSYRTQTRNAPQMLHLHTHPGTTGSNCSPASPATRWAHLGCSTHPSNLQQIATNSVTPATRYRAPLPNNSKLTPTTSPSPASQHDESLSQATGPTTQAQPAPAQRLAQTTSSTTTLHATLLNTWSMVKHATEIHDLIVTNGLDLLAVTESWLHCAAGHTISLAVPPEYSILRADRINGKGGGVALIYRSELAIRLTDTPRITDCDIITAKLSTSPTSTINLCLIYCPPGSASTFEDDLSQLISPAIKPATENLLLGDLNLRLNDPLDPAALSLPPP